MTRVLHKAVGYGFKDLKHESGELTDKRVLYSRLFDRIKESALGKWNGLSKFLQWIRQVHRKDRLIELWEQEVPENADRDVDHLFKQWRRWSRRVQFKRWRPIDSIIWSATHGNPGVMLFIPPECSVLWHRIEDPIDLGTSVLADVDRWACYDTHTRGIPPYDKTMVRFRQRFLGAVGEEAYSYPTYLGRVHVDGFGPTFMPTDAWYLLASGPDAIATGEVLTHLREDWRPQVPLPVLALMLWTQCFWDARKAAQDVRPLVYEYIERR